MEWLVYVTIWPAVWERSCWYGNTKSNRINTLFFWRQRHQRSCGLSHPFPELCQTHMVKCWWAKVEHCSIEQRPLGAVGHFRLLSFCALRDRALWHWAHFGLTCSSGGRHQTELKQKPQAWSYCFFRNNVLLLLWNSWMWYWLDWLQACCNQSGWVGHLFSCLD